LFPQHLSLGTMVIGDQIDLAGGKALLDSWFEEGEKEIDTAFMYPVSVFWFGTIRFGY
jgi:aryl-alcohol dehydrogenase-like predicted oxidoreductase